MRKWVRIGAEFCRKFKLFQKMLQTKVDLNYYISYKKLSERISLTLLGMKQGGVNICYF